MTKDGCFEHCTNCNSDISCCCNFDVINAPVLNKQELERLKQFLNSDDFYNVLGNNLFSLKTIGNKCIFYQNNKCLIYNIRPVDCRLYPFDIIKSNDKYYLILYLLSCINNKSFYVENHNIDSLISDVVSWINEFTDEQNYTKMKTKKYATIKEIKL